ncbi:hypothetical protein [Thermomonospora cellulosilytica]|uniref:HEAT repeat domain-containing protein n=1 Tax=Thermomonospora cellulosilytica TaxID=1411118 RepID=A0A7W3MVF1_9ACTN|nr:hypothetical protein [Thermomonospora cellulosilytica]MBA9002615.1 hypothetical protein [Thermomonospora cellulosilytica]
MEGAAPLAGLDDVGWDRLLDCRGDTGKVPELLRTLWRSGAGVLRELEDRLVPWHDLNDCRAVRDATPAAVPFLVRLAQDRRTAARDGVLHLLVLIAETADRGPVDTCFGVWPDRWLRACARALARTGVAGWCDLLDEDPERRRAVLRILAAAARADERVPGLVWESVLNAEDGERLRERVVCLAYATAEDPWGESWADPLRDWLERPAARETATVMRIALEHLPWWVDADTLDALGDLVYEGIERC